MRSFLQPTGFDTKFSSVYKDSSSEQQNGDENVLEFNSAIRSEYPLFSNCEMDGGVFHKNLNLFCLKLSTDYSPEFLSPEECQVSWFERSNDADIKVESNLSKSHSGINNLSLQPDLSKLEINSILNTKNHNFEQKFRSAGELNDNWSMQCSVQNDMTQNDEWNQT